MDRTLIGQIVLNFNLISEEQLDHCIELQSLNGRPLGDILISEGILTEKALHSILAVQKKQVGKERSASALVAAAPAEQRTIPELITLARSKGAAELVITAGTVPTVRINGEWVDLTKNPITREGCQTQIFALLTPEQIEQYRDARCLSALLEPEGAGRVRAHFYRHLGGVGGVFRMIADAPRCFEELGLPPMVGRFIDFSHGLVLITGPVDSGKSTTVAALIDLINQSQRRHIITIEKPIEILHDSSRSLISQIEVGTHVAGFSEALASALRQDPDVIVVGDLVDAEIAATALTAAETGHLVFATMHTQNAFRTLTRLLDLFPAGKRDHARSLLSNTLRAIVSQDLVPEIGGRGRSMACEVLVGNAAIANMIREDKIWQIPMVLQTNQKQGMQTMDESLKHLVAERRIADDVARERTSEHERTLVKR